MLFLKSLGIHGLLNFGIMDLPPAEALLKPLEFTLNKLGALTKVGRGMVVTNSTSVLMK